VLLVLDVSTAVIALPLDMLLLPVAMRVNLLRVQLGFCEYFAPHSASTRYSSWVQ
jgi:hypothetical protein